MLRHYIHTISIEQLQPWSVGQSVSPPARAAELEKALRYALHGRLDGALDKCFALRRGFDLT